MAVLELSGVEIDRCLSCLGTWLDAGEMERIALLAGASPQLIAEVLGGARARGLSGRRRCPRCRKRLGRIDAGGIELDRCPRDHGLWLDKGEISGLIASLRGGAADTLSRHFADLFEHELAQGPRGR